MAGKFNKKKKSRFVPPISFVKPENFILKKGRSLPIYECRMMDGWFEGGKNQIMVVRRNEYWAYPDKKQMDACLKTIEEVIETYEKEQD